MFKSTHNLDFEVANYADNLVIFQDWKRFRIGTCEGLWRYFENCYEILAIDNTEKGNGHLVDVFEWFENSCKRDKYDLKILEFFNIKFKEYLIRERGFIEYSENNVIKYFKK